MSRAIEFRAWHKPTKRMFNVYSFSRSEVFEDCLDGPGSTPYVPAKREDCEIIQFTGLLDKTGAKIFEGDTVKYESVVDRIDDEPYDFVGEVIYSGACFFVCGKTGRDLEQLGNKPRSCEVIGNKFEGIKEKAK